jgi:hypothetical protein
VAIRALFPNLAGTPYVGFHAESGFGHYGIQDGSNDMTPGLTDDEEEERRSANAAAAAGAHANDAFDFAGHGTH